MRLFGTIMTWVWKGQDCHHSSYTLRAKFHPSCTSLLEKFMCLSSCQWFLPPSCKSHWWIDNAYKPASSPLPQALFLDSILSTHYRPGGVHFSILHSVRSQWPSEELDTTISSVRERRSPGLSQPWLLASLLGTFLGSLFTFAFQQIIN